MDEVESVSTSTSNPTSILLQENQRIYELLNDNSVEIAIDVEVEIDKFILPLLDPSSK